MSLRIAELRSLIADALDPLIGIRVYDYMEPSPLTPAVVIWPDSIPAAETIGGFRRPVMVVRVIVTTGNAKAATADLDDYLDQIEQTLGAAAAINLASPVVRNYGHAPAIDGTVWLQADLVFDVY
jgi:hypothetical protein